MDAAESDDVNQSDENSYDSSSDISMHLGHNREASLAARRKKVIAGAEYSSGEDDDDSNALYQTSLLHLRKQSMVFT